MGTSQVVHDRRSNMQLTSINDVYTHEIQDLYSAETQLIQALPQMAQAASGDELRQAFQHHFDETQGQVERLQEIMGQAGISPGEECKGMAGLIAEGQEIIAAQGDPTVKDAALISAAQRVEHYEIAAYGTARSLADELGMDESKDLLDQTLDEESDADKLLTKIATGGMLKAGINQQARN